MAWNIRRLRVAQSISQDRLAADAGVDRAYFGGLERQAENPTVDTLDKIAMALSVPLSEFFVLPPAGEEPPKTLRSGRKSA